VGAQHEPAGPVKENQEALIRHYDDLAGRSLDRIWNLSDSVFAFALTLLVFNMHLPDPGVIHGEADLLAALARSWPQAATYLMSFLTLGIFWVNQQTQHNLMARSDRNAAWLHLVLLAVVVFVPVSTNLLTEFVSYRIAIVVYWLNFVALGCAFLAAWTYAVRAGLLKPEADRDMIAAVYRRMIVAQVLFALAAALCVVGTLWSIGFMVLVQVNYALAPPIPWLRRLTT
jgi:uncharacterized membrane protein